MRKGTSSADWTNPSSYHDTWAGRSEIIAGLLPPSASVLDIGAGNRVLKRFHKGPYTPADYHAWSDDTIIIDLNGEWDATPLQAHDYTVLAGVLEHINTPIETLCRALAYANSVVVTYMDNRKWDMAGLASLKDIEGAAFDYGYRIEAQTWWEHQAIYHLKRGR